MAMTLVSTVTVGSGGAEVVEITNIPQTGKDLLILTSLRGTTSLSHLASVNLNGDTTNANYSGRELVGNGSAASSNTDYARPFFLIPDGSFTASTFGNSATYISNYTSSAAKSISTDAVTENNATASEQKIHASSYNLTTAITSITVRSSRSNFVENSTVSLYLIS